MVVLRALGNAEIETSVAIITPSQEIVFAAALFLILERGKSVSRARLSSILWPRVPENPRAHRMRQTILQLKKLGVPLVVDRNTLQLGDSQTVRDFDDLERIVSSTGDASLEFLPGYNPRFSEDLCDWVDRVRGMVQGTLTTMLLRGLSEARLKGNWIVAEKIAADCLTLDPYNESAVLAKAEAIAMRGGKQKALSILDDYLKEVGSSDGQLRLPAAVLRRRVADKVPEQAAVLTSESTFVGRETEMQSLVRGLECARDGNGSGRLIIGPAGIGKSRLSGELARFAELQGAQVQRLKCRRTDRERPLSVFVDSIPQLRELPGALGCAPDTFTFLKRLTDVETHPGESPQANHFQPLFEQTRSALLDLFDSVADERCLVVLIEDLQWLDDSSISMLALMIEWASTRRIFFLMNSRSELSLSQLADASNLEVMQLGPLSSAAATSLLHSLKVRRDDDATAELVDWCLAVAEGNPFFLQELVNQWIETRQRHEAPPSVAKVLGERLSRISQEALQVLQTAAVLGEQATIRRVERILEYPSHRLLSAVEELSKAAMLRPSAHSDEGWDERLHPRHDLLSSASIARLAPISLAFIHRRSADILENEITHATMPTTLLWACASHRHHAGDRERALGLSLSCAEHLLDVGLQDDACSAFQKSLDYCTTDIERLRVFPRFAAAAQLNGEWDKSKELLRSCIRLNAKTNPLGLHNEFELQLFAARHQTEFDFASLLEDLMPCIECKDAPPTHRVKAAVIALKLATDVGPPELLDSIYGQIETLLTKEEVNASARFEAQLIYRTTRKKETVREEELVGFPDSTRLIEGELAYSNALLTAAAACRTTARYELGLAFTSTAFNHALSQKWTTRLARVCVTELALHVAAGEYARAEDALSRVESHAQSSGNNFVFAEVDYFKVRIALENGDLPAASIALASIKPLPMRCSARRRANYLAFQIQIRLLEGADLELVRPLVDQLELDHEKTQGLAGQDFEAYSLYLGLSVLGDSSRAFRLLESYVTTHRRSNWPLPKLIREALQINELVSEQYTT